MTPKDLHKTIKESYLLAFDEAKSIEDRKLGARNVVTTIVENVFFENHKIKEAFTSVNSAIDEKKIDRKYLYKTTFTDRLKFLCDYGHIKPSLQSEYVFINGEAGMHSSAHMAFKEGEKRLIHVMKIFLNEILESFLSNSEGDKSYLIPMHVIAQDDPKFHKRMVGRIETFWNNEGKNFGLKKYRTIALYLAGLIATLTSPILSIVIATFGILNTRKFVFNKKVKRLRYTVFVFFAIVSIILMGVGSYRINKFKEEGASFDVEAFGDGKGFVALSKSEELNTKLVTDTLNIQSLQKHEHMDFYVFHAYRNNGMRSMHASASLEIIEQKNQIIFVGNLMSYNAINVSDSTYVTNISSPYHVQFLDGLMINNQGQHNIDNCEKSLYKEIIHPQFYIKNYPNDLERNFDNGTPLRELDIYNNGWCDAGYIVSRFRITKL